MAAKHKAGTADRILDTAERLVQVRGFNAFSYADISEALAEIEATSPGAYARIERYAEIYGSVLRKKRMCLCGMLAADFATLPKGMRESVAAFFAENEAWLSRVLDDGRRAGGLEFDGAVGPMAASIVSAFEGAMLVARVRGNPDHFDSVAQQVLLRVRPTKAALKPRRA